MSGLRYRCLLTLICLAAIVVGCEPESPTEKARKDPLVQALSKVGYMYHNYHDAHGGGPGSWEELATMANDDRANLDAIQTAKDKGYTVRWGVKFSELTEGMVNSVMAESPQGGPKLMFDGSVRL